MKNGPILITGGAGFIGSALVRYLIAEEEREVVVLDKLTYAGNVDSFGPAKDSSKLTFVEGDICDATLVAELLQKHRPCGIMHLAAESHVDRSIDGPLEFVQTNIVGTATLLDEARKYHLDLDEKARAAFRFHHISTDEVYGSLGAEGLFSESTPYDPRSPYSASKASSDHLVRAWFHTYDFPVLITNCSNNYGPYHFPEKLIPLVILNALAGRELPIYGAGDQVRDWLYVEDHVRALYTVFCKGAVGETYNIGGHNEKQNIEVVQTICTLLDELQPSSQPYAEQITHVRDRPGHDKRYAIDAGKIARDLGWQPRESFATGMRKTVEWYLENRAWCETIQAKCADALTRRGSL